MRGINKERIKSIAIIGLLITSLIQVGILWGYQSQGTPTNFLSGIWIFGRPEQELSDDEVCEKLFVPYRLVISNGEKAHWLIGRNNPLFEQITREAGVYLKNIVEGNLVRSKSSENWGDITSKQGFMLEFKAALGPELLKLFTGASKISGDAPVVLKMMIKPDAVNESFSEVYILSPDGGLGRYSASGVERPQSMQDMLAAYDKEDGESPYRNYTTMRDGNLDRYKPYEPDVLYVAASPVLWPYYRLQAAVPARALQTNELADVMLGSEKGRFVENISEGLRQFSNTENMYRIFDDGYLSYKYIADINPSEKGGVGDALVKAYAFIDRINGLTNMKADIYLSGIYDPGQGYYTFTFDYMFDDMPVFMNLLMQGSDEPVVNAITVNASSKRVLQCEWALRDFTQGQKQPYNDRFTDVMIYNGIKHGDMKITDIAAGYYLDSAEKHIIDPSLIIKEKGKTDVQAFMMPSGKGD